MMKLVVFAAVVSACAVGIARLNDLGTIGGWAFVALWVVVGVPLACAVVALPLLRTGPLKDWLVRTLLSIPVAVTPGLALVLLGSTAYRAVAGSDAFMYYALSVMAAVTIALGALLALLVRWIIPGWCLECRLPLLIPDVAAHGAPQVGPERPYRCMSCDGQYRKRDGAWQSVASDGSS